MWRWGFRLRSSCLPSPNYHPLSHLSSYTGCLSKWVWFLLHWLKWVFGVEITHRMKKRRKTCSLLKEELRVPVAPEIRGTCRRLCLPVSVWLAHFLSWNGKASGCSFECPEHLLVAHADDHRGLLGITNGTIPLKPTTQVALKWKHLRVSLQEGSAFLLQKAFMKINKLVFLVVIRNSGKALLLCILEIYEDLHYWDI